MKDTLYIIGNGFDLNHGLPTAYLDFRDSYAKRRPALWRTLERLYGNNLNKELWWSDFETKLGEVDYSHLQNSRNGEAIGSFIAKDFFKYNLCFFFGDWIKGINNKITTSLTIRKDINKEALFFTFNYTTLLETLYDIKSTNILHIHKSVNNLKADEHALIIGHDSSFAQLMKYPVEQVIQTLSRQYIDDINAEIIKGAKNVKMRVAEFEEEFKQLYASIKHFIIMGFSLNNIDKPYIEKIIEVNNNIDATDWTIYYHAKGENESLKKKLMNLGILERNINEPIYW